MNQLIIEMYSKLPQMVRLPLRDVAMLILRARMKKFFGQFIKPRSLVFDIGANTGEYTRIYREMGARVVCVEPQPDCVKEIRQKFGDDKQVFIVPAGINEKAGTEILHISNSNNPLSTFSEKFIAASRYSNRKWEKSVKIKMLTLQQLINKYGLPDFCKIDVEGYEWEVIRTMKKPIPALSFEFLSEFGSKTAGIVKFLDRLGQYEYNISLWMDNKFALGHWVSGKEIITILNKNENRKWFGDIYARRPQK